MKILLLKYCDNHPGGSGSEASLLHTMQYLGGRGVSVRMVYYYLRADVERHIHATRDFLWDVMEEDTDYLKVNSGHVDIELVGLEDDAAIQEHLRNLVRHYSPDWLSWMYFNTRMATFISEFTKIKKAAYSYDFMFPQPGHMSATLRELYKSVPVFSNSQTIAAAIKHTWRVETRFLPPFIVPSNYVNNKRTPRYVTLLGGALHKGLQHVIRLAEQMPETEFMIIGDVPSDMEARVAKIPGLHLEPSRLKTTDIYKNTRILLLPSLLPVSFPRTVIEAGLNGIPAIGFDYGGVKEAMGAGGELVPLPENKDNLLSMGGKLPLEPWMAAIHKVETHYDDYAVNAHSNAFQFVHEIYTFLNAFEGFLKSAAETSR